MVVQSRLYTADDLWEISQGDDGQHYGTRLVWFVYPDERSIDVCHPGRPIQIENYDLSGILSGEAVLPDFKLPVQEIFRKLRD